MKLTEENKAKYKTEYTNLPFDKVQIYRKFNGKWEYLDSIIPSDGDIVWAEKEALKYIEVYDYTLKNKPTEPIKYYE